MFLKFEKCDCKLRDIYIRHICSKQSKYFNPHLSSIDFVTVQKGNPYFLNFQ